SIFFIEKLAGNSNPYAHCRHWLLATKSGQPANHCPGHQKDRRPKAELAPVPAVKAVMRCGVDLGPKFTECGNFFGNSFHGIMIPLRKPEPLAAAPRYLVFARSLPAQDQPKRLILLQAQKTAPPRCRSDAGDQPRARNVAPRLNQTKFLK